MPSIRRLSPIRDLTLLLALLAGARCLATDTLSAVWMEIGTVYDQNRRCQYRLSREVGVESPRTIVTVHREVGRTKRTGAVYASRPCDIWIDLDRDGVLRTDEHRHLAAAESWCVFPGELTVLPGTAYTTTLLVLAPGYEDRSGGLPVVLRSQVVNVATLLGQKRERSASSTISRGGR